MLLLASNFCSQLQLIFNLFQPQTTIKNLHTISQSGCWKCYPPLKIPPHFQGPITKKLKIKEYKGKKIAHIMAIRKYVGYGYRWHPQKYFWLKLPSNFHDAQIFFKVSAQLHVLPQLWILFFLGQLNPNKLVSPSTFTI